MVEWSATGFATVARGGDAGEGLVARVTGGLGVGRTAGLGAGRVAGFGPGGGAGLGAGFGGSILMPGGMVWPAC